MEGEHNVLKTIYLFLIACGFPSFQNIVDSRVNWRRSLEVGIYYKDIFRIINSRSLITQGQCLNVIIVNYERHTFTYIQFNWGCLQLS